jgi:glutamine---fructose-6-phosphate transaminase (isomerizing)
MCGIFGYIGEKSNAAHIVIEGLKRLDYRGYDSWGVAVTDGKKIHMQKQVGKISDIADIKDFPQSSVGIAHTRWATTGAVTQPNAHPHAASDNSFVLAQNGIVENYEELKEELLKKGYTFKSETDTEVIVRLIEEERKKAPNLITAIRNAFLKLTGRNTIIILTNDDQILACRNGSPLVIGINTITQDIYLSSDTLSFAHAAQEMIVVENGHLVHLSQNEPLKIFDVKTGKKTSYTIEPITITNQIIDKQGFEHYMMKEIFDSPQVIEALVKQNHKAYENLAQAIKKAHRVYTIGSGTAGIAAAQIAFYLRHFAHIEAVNLIGADAGEYDELFTKNDLLIAPSQSGETADVLEVLEKAKAKGVKIASLVNMPGSLMTRMSDYAFMNEAGPEICVMSTKVFTSQIAWGYLVAKTVSGKAEEGRKNLSSLAKHIHDYLQDKNNHTAIKKLAQHLLKAKDIFLLGKNQNLQIMREGMVKLIEGSYKHAHAIPAGDLKHYAITLIEKGVPVITALSDDETKNDVLNAIGEVRARGAEVIAIAQEKHANFDYLLPVPNTEETSAIMNIIPLQLLAYYLADALGNNIDKPRNIAKSVTVK